MTPQAGSGRASGNVSALTPRDNESDAALVSAALMGESRACFALWLRYSPLVRRLILRFFGPGPDHPDLCQEVFLRVFSRLGELRDPGAMGGFVAGICLGVARNELRRRKVRRLVGLSDEIELAESTAAVGAVDESREITRRLYAVLAEVSAEERSLFITRYIERMELAEVAAVHGIGISTTKRRLARMSRRLSARMQRDPALAELAARLGAGRT